jgi:hypothetical protein
VIQLVYVSCKREDAALKSRFILYNNVTRVCSSTHCYIVVCLPDPCFISFHVAQGSIRRRSNT